MDNNFLSYQISSYKSLLDLFNYEFTSSKKSYRLFDMVRTHLIESKQNPILDEIIEQKNLKNSSYFNSNFALEYSDVFYNADDFEQVAEKFVELFYAYNFYDGKKKLITTDFSYSNTYKLDYRRLNLKNIGYSYNPKLKDVFKIIGDFEAPSIQNQYQNITNYYRFKDALNTLSFCDLKEKGITDFVFSEQFNSVFFNQSVTGLLPLDNFSWKMDESGKQVKFEKDDYSYETTVLDKIEFIQYNNSKIKELIDEIKSIESVKSSEYGYKYIGKLNKKAIAKSNILFYALSNFKGDSEEFVNTNFNLIFDKDRTISTVIDGFDFMYAIMWLCKFDNGEFIDIYYNENSNKITILSENKSNIKIQTGFDSNTLTPIYEFIDIKKIINIPTIQKDYAKIINECWLYSYSAASTIKEIIENTKEEDETFKISIPTDFLNQKEILTKEQLFKIESVEERLSKTKLKGRELLDRLVSYCEEYILTYADKIEERIIDDKSKEKINYFYTKKKNLSSTFSYDNVVNNDYIWKVNELFWDYNKQISIRELIAYFVAKGDQYNYRLLSYRILGVDCYMLKSKLLEQLLIESLVFIEEFNINIEEKSIERPMKISYKYEYGTGNYYKKKRNFAKIDISNLSVLPLNESIMNYFGQEVGEIINQNHVSFLDNDLIKPKEMTWNSKSDSSVLYCSSTDPIFLNNTNLQEVEVKNRTYPANISKLFYKYIEKTNLVNSEITKQQILNGYIYRLPESVSLALSFLKAFKCFKIAVLSKDNPNNNKGKDVFAVFGLYDLQNEEPLFIGEDTINDNDCKNYINSKPHNGGIALKRKELKGKDNGTYLFTKKLNNLTDNSFSNLYEGKFITQQEYVSKQFIGEPLLEDKTKLVFPSRAKTINEIMISYNQLVSKVIMEGDYQFNKFCQTELKDEYSLLIQRTWNETYNYEMYPKKIVKSEGFNEGISKLNNDKFPIFIEHSRYFGKSTNEFILNNNQIDGVKFYVGNKNSGLLAHEVGFGKTSTSICSISHQLLTGEAKRIMLSVPNAVYVNFIREIKGEIGVRRGLIPHIELIELKNASSSVFLKYDKQYTQISGIKDYSKNQIKNIDSYKNISSEIVKTLNPTKKTYNVIHIDDFEGYKNKTDDFIKFVEKVFDKKLLDWRIENFFTELLRGMESLLSDAYTIWRNDLFTFQNEESSKIDKIENNSRLNPIEKNEKKSKISKEYTNKKTKKFLEICKDYTVQLIYFIRSSENQIFDKIGTYKPQFMSKNCIVISTHEALGQLRLNKEIAEKVSNNLKDNIQYSRALLNNAISYDKLAIDSLIVDEVHNFNELFAFSKRQISQIKLQKSKGAAFRRENYNIEYVEELRGLIYAKKKRGNDLSSITKFNMAGKYTSTKKATLYGICKTLQENYKSKGNYNILLLSATPFVDDLYQMIGVFNMLRNFDTPIEFFSNYLYQDWDWENDHKGDTVLKVQTSTFKNDDARNNWIKLFSQFYTFDAKINENRPYKFTYPYDCNSKSNIAHYKDNCDSKVYLDFTKEQYAIYENIGKYLEGVIGYESIVPSVKSEVLATEIFIEPEYIEIVNELLDEDSPQYSPEEAVKIFVENDWINVLNDKKNSSYNDILAIYEIIKEQIDTTEEEEVEDTGDDDEGKSTEDLNDSDTISGIGQEKGGQRALKGQDLGKKLALSPYLVTPKDAGLGNINPNLPIMYGISTAENRYKSAKVFVETSPKLYFTCQAIKCLIDYHINREEDITGQIIYISFGQKFTYGGVKYNAMELLKSYLEELLNMKESFKAKETDDVGNVKQYDLSQVQIVSGMIQDPLYKNAISNSFNEGKIKVLIGSSTIKEGVNLQGSKEFNHGNSTIYITTSDYAPMLYMQLEGRVWRQGNPLENVRMVYPLIKNSIDLHIYSKVKEKITKVKNMLEAGIYNFKETQFEKDIEGVSLALNTNVNEKVKVIWSKRERRLNEEKKSYDGISLRLNTLKTVYPKAITTISSFSKIFNVVSMSLQDYYAGIKIRNEYSKQRDVIKALFRQKKENIYNELTKKYELDIANYDKEKDKNEKINEGNKKKKIPAVPFDLIKPLKKDYVIDSATLDNLDQEELKSLKDAELEIEKQVSYNITEKKYDTQNMFYHQDISETMTYTEIASIVANFADDVSYLWFTPFKKSDILRIDDSIKEKGLYFAVTSKTEFINYSISKIDDLLLEILYEDIQQLPLSKNIFPLYGFSPFEKVIWEFKNVMKLFTFGSDIEAIMNDYQDFIYTKGKTISDINNIIYEYDDKIIDINKQISAKNEFIAEKRKIFIEEEEKLQAERDKLTNMKEYVMADVDKFCKTNKFIYLRGSITEEQKQQFELKK